MSVFLCSFYWKGYFCLFSLVKQYWTCRLFVNSQQRKLIGLLILLLDYITQFSEEKHSFLPITGFSRIKCKHRIHFLVPLENFAVSDFVIKLNKKTNFRDSANWSFPVIPSQCENSKISLSLIFMGGRSDTENTVWKHKNVRYLSNHYFIAKE